MVGEGQCLGLDKWGAGGYAERRLGRVSQAQETTHRAQKGVCTETDLGCTEPSSAICAPGEMDTRTEAGPRMALSYRLQEAEALMCRNWGPLQVPGQAGS